MNTVILVEFALYMLLMLIIGLHFGRKKMNQEEYHLGGKKLPGFALALSERATGESAWLILGLTGFAYAKGLSAVWVAIGCVTGVILSWLLLSRRFREEAERYGVFTFTDYLAVKYARRSTFIRWYASAIIVFFYVVYVSAQFGGGGKVVHQTFRLDPTTGMLAASLIVILYSMAGGFAAVVWTDAVQALLMAATFIVTPVFALVVAAGKGATLSEALSAAGSGTMDAWAGGAVGVTAGLMIFNNLSWCFGYLGGQPQLSTRWMAMKDDRSVRQGTIIAVVWTLAAYAGAIAIGLSALMLYGPNAVADKEQILPKLLLDLMPAWLAGFLLVGAVAAMMSTASSQLIIATTAVTEDILHKALGLKLPDATLVRISRVTLLAVGALGLLLAYLSDKLIYVIVHYAWSGIGNSFAPAVLLAFFWPRFSSAGVVGSLLGGSVTTLVWWALDLDAKVSVLAVSFFAALALAAGCSLLWPDREPAASSPVSDAEGHSAATA